jgi:hypothetical protein
LLLVVDQRSKNKKNTNEGIISILFFHTIPNTTRINMKLSVTLAILASVNSYANASLRGLNKNPIESELKCMFEGINNSEKCAIALNDAGAPCSFCTVKSDDASDQVGICVDPTVAQTMEQTSPTLSCTNVNMVVSKKVFFEEKIVNDYHDYKCSIKGFEDPEKCGTMHTDDGKKHCTFCIAKGPFGDQGLCVSPAHARALKHLSPEIHCSKKDAIEEEAVVQDREEMHTLQDVNESMVGAA